MKRYFKITLINGKELELDFKKAFTDAFIPNVPPTHPSLLKAAMDIGCTGFMEPGTDERPKIITPSQIKHVEVVIEEQNSNAVDKI